MIIESSRRNYLSQGLFGCCVIALLSFVDADRKAVERYAKLMPMNGYVVMQFDIACIDGWCDSYDLTSFYYVDSASLNVYSLWQLSAFDSCSFQSGIPQDKKIERIHRHFQQGCNVPLKELRYLTVNNQLGSCSPLNDPLYLGKKKNERLYTSSFVLDSTDSLPDRLFIIRKVQTLGIYFNGLTTFDLVSEKSSNTIVNMNPSYFEQHLDHANFWSLYKNISVRECDSVPGMSFLYKNKSKIITLPMRE